MCGVTERFRFSWTDGQQAAEQLRQVLENNGDEILYAAENGVTGRRQLSKTTVLWSRYDLAGEESYAVRVKQVLLGPGEEIDLPLERQQADEVIFYTAHPGDRLMRLEVIAPDADLSLEGSYRQAFGKLVRNVGTQVECPHFHGPLHEIGQVPQYRGDIKWKMHLDGGVERIQVRVRWSGGPPLEPLQAGDALGGIRLRNVVYGRASASPEFEDSIEHPAFGEGSLNGDRTPLGETVFWLPPGYWTIHVAPERQPEQLQGFAGLTGHLIPVQPGRITVVDWPPSLARVFATGDSGHLEILEATADRSKGKVDIALLGTGRLGVVPSPANVRIFDSGTPAPVLAVERLHTPLNVLLLLDSSGSMKRQMARTLAAAAHFIRGLPADARVTVVDFDTRPRRLPAANRRQLLAALRRVRAGGATALFDSILLGLEQLRGKNRPALVVFTDGRDANLDDSGPGSRAGKEEVLAAVHRAEIPVFTIGLGEKSDSDTLQRLAALSGGSFYRAGKPEDLDPIFEKIEANLSNSYRIRFRRPPRPRFANVPVVSLVVDNSGSMDSDPEQAGCGYRIERVRQTLRRFIEELPEDFLVQLLVFNDEVGIQQVLTGEHAPLERALSLMKGNGGTNTLGAVRASLDSLRALPSSQRYLVFLTDAALEVEQDRIKEFATLLGMLRDSNVHSLWLGMVEDRDKEVFARAAELSGGRYVISTDLERLAQVFKDLAHELSSVKKPAAGGTLRVEVHHHDAAGVNVNLVASREVKFPPAEEADVPVRPECLSWHAGPALRPYDPRLAGDISGSDRAGYQVLVEKRIPLDYTAANRAMQLHLQEAIFLSRLRGIDAPEGYRYLALTLDMKNILPPQRVAVLPDGSHHPASWVGGGGKPVRYEKRVPTYLIPDLQRHCFLRWNNSRSFAVSEVSWLLENPLLVPGDNALALTPRRPVHGALAFLVPAEAARAASLRIYDTNYGHLVAPLWGVTATDEPDSLNNLPQESPSRLSQAFSFRVSGYRDAQRVDNVDAGADAVFRIFSGELLSHVQAHLSLDPAQRILLRVEDEQGARFFRLHPITGRLPLGYYRSTLFTPGSRNRVALAFRLPRRLVATQRPMALLFDLAGGAVLVPAVGSPGGQRLEIPASAGNRDVEIFVHRASRVEGVSGFGDNLVTVDATFLVPPGRGHLRVGELLVLKGRKFDAASVTKEVTCIKKVRRLPVPWVHRSLSSFGQTYLPPRQDRLPGTLLPVAAEYALPLALDGDSLLPAGQARRGWLLFELPPDSTVDDWRVGSLLFADLALPISGEKLTEPLLRFERLRLPDDGSEAFWSRVAAKVEELSARRKAAGWQKPGRVPLRVVGVKGSEETGPRLDPPGMTWAGASALSAWNTRDDLERLKKLRWLPGGEPWAIRYSPEAVLTQNWGTESDLSALAERILSRSGTSSERVTVKLLERGKQELARRTGLENVSIERLPALRWRNTAGAETVLVSPFFQDVRALQGLVDYHAEALPESPRLRANVVIGLLVQPRSGERQQQLMHAADVLAGQEEGGPQEVALLDETFDLADLSVDCLDVGFTRVPARGTVVYKAVLDGPAGRRITTDDEAPEATGMNILGWYYQIRTPESSYSRRLALPAETEITGVFLTLGINPPELPPASLQLLDRARQKLRREANVTPDSFSGLRWYTRGIAARFLGAQSAWENEFSRRLGLVSGRSSRTRAFVVTVTKDSGAGRLQARLDLLDTFPQVHHAAEPRAERAFRILGGLAAAEFEAAALGPHGAGLWQIWRQSPPQTRLLFVADDNREQFVELLRTRSYPPQLVRRLAASERFLLFPSSPGVVAGKVRWAWLEVDPQSYDVRAVLDDGSGGAMVESIIGNLYEQASSYLVGAFVGISTSLWSVAAFSLQLEDYRKILRRAEAFARGLGNNFSAGNQYAGLPVGGLPSASVSLDRAVTFSLDSNGVSFSNNLLGFGNGYQDGISYYFKNAR